MSIIDDTLDRAKLCYGPNALAWDRLFKGNDQQAAFYLKLIHERRDMQAALDTAAFLIAERDAELSDLRADKVAAGVSSMSLGEVE